jgi:hypothetical protein
MSNVGSQGRSYRAIGLDDLRKLVLIAREDQTSFFRNYPGWARLYSHRLVCIALCQGAALHYLDNRTGINDFDVYTFYKRHPAKSWYSKGIKSYDFGDAKFGQSLDHPNFIGRRVDCLARSIEVHAKEHAATSLQRYLEDGKTETARLLATKAVIVLEPNCGTVVWPK